MKLTTNLKALAAAAVLAIPAMAPTTANAEFGYNAAVSSMYLFRGTDASNGPAVSGGADYSHASGAYASVWASSGIGSNETDGGGYEFDAWLGYAGEVSGFSYDLSYWSIDYPQSYGAEAATETALGLGYMDVSLGLVSGDGYTYTTLGYAIGDVSFTYGMNATDAVGGDTSHFDVSFAASNELTLTMSFPNDDDAATGDPALASLFVVSYSLPISK
ncbi:MAG: TorF family putative porin [Gammaproteobacteria bacterium]|nr:TorF family putative porin [Gammaproteobacteria bacterium]